MDIIAHACIDRIFLTMRGLHHTMDRGLASAVRGCDGSNTDERNREHCSKASNTFTA